MKRIALFLATNIAIVLVLGITLRILGFERILDEQGVGLDINSLLVFAAVFGFGGSLISLAISKWTAKRFTGAKVIETPRNAAETWLHNTVRRQAELAGIGMPEVAIYDSPDINAFATGMSRNNALVAVSTGLLANMSKDEAEAVLGHEVSHVANGDMVTLALIQGVVNTFVIFMSRVIGHAGRSRHFQSRTRPRPGVLDYRDHRRDTARDTRQHHRHVVQSPARISRRCRWCASRRAAENDCRAGAVEVFGATAAFTGSASCLWYQRWPRVWHKTPFHDPPATG